MGLLSAFDGTSWRDRSGQDPWSIYLNITGWSVGWHTIQGFWVMEVSQTQDSPPVVTYNWRKMYDQTPPTVAPSNPVVSSGTLTETWPKAAQVAWTNPNGSSGFGAWADFYRSTDGGASYFLADSQSENDNTLGPLTSAALFNEGDLCYAVVYYFNTDGGGAGPSTQSPTFTF